MFTKLISNFLFLMVLSVIVSGLAKPVNNEPADESENDSPDKHPKVNVTDTKQLPDVTSAALSSKGITVENNSDKTKDGVNDIKINGNKRKKLNNAKKSNKTTIETGDDNQVEKTEVKLKKVNQEQDHSKQDSKNVNQEKDQSKQSERKVNEEQGQPEHKTRKVSEEQRQSEQNTRNVDPEKDSSKQNIRKSDQGQDQSKQDSRKVDQGQDQLKSNPRKVDQRQDQLKPNPRKVEQGQDKLKLNSSQVEDKSKLDLSKEKNETTVVSKSVTKKIKGKNVPGYVKKKTEFKKTDELDTKKVDEADNKNTDDSKDTKSVPKGPEDKRKPGISLVKTNDKKSSETLKRKTIIISGDTESKMKPSDTFENDSRERKRPKSYVKNGIPDDAADSNSSSHFMMIIFFGLLFTIVGYVCFQKRKKIMAYIVEGRRKTTRGRRNSSHSETKVAYKPLDSEDKEAGTSNYKYVY